MRPYTPVLIIHDSPNLSTVVLLFDYRDELPLPNLIENFHMQLAMAKHTGNKQRSLISRVA